MPRPTPRGRGAAIDPAQRFTGREVVWDGDELDFEEATGEGAPERTRVFRDASRSVLSHNTSPDIPFDVSLNPYRGCEHGCPYCFARPTHEYLGLSAGLDFERRVFAKPEAPALLAGELAKPSWRPRHLAMSGVTDPYQPVERLLGITRGCLEVLAAHRHPVGVITKNALVVRDVDLLAELARWGAVRVAVSITTLDEDLRRRLEPRTSTARARLEAIRTLAEAGVPVGVNVAPVIPGLNDREVPAILGAAADHGAQGAAWTLLRLPGAVEPIFVDWLHAHAPLRADRVLARVREPRAGALSDARFGHRHRGEGVYARQLGQLFDVQRRRAGLDRRWPPLATEHFRVPGRALQGALFAAGTEPGAGHDRR
jgi:DNA repair photolyase